MPIDSPDSVLETWAQAQQAVRAQSWKRARHLLSQLTELQPAASTSDIWLQACVALAQLEASQQNPDSASDLWERILAQDIEHPLAQARLNQQSGPAGRLEQGSKSKTERGLQTGLTPLDSLQSPQDQSDGSADAQASVSLTALSATTPPDASQAALSHPTLLSPEGATISSYEILEEIGRGSSCTVYRARHVLLHTQVALKVLHPVFEGAPHDNARSQFFREARIAGRLRHPGLVTLLEIDEPARSLVMEFVGGGTLRDSLRQRARGNGGLESTNHFNPLRLRQLARALLEAIGHVHRAGLIHGDIKPSNILLRSACEPVLADFGSARLSPRQRESRSAASQPAQSLQNDMARELGGTPLFWAPEQLRGAAASPASDLFALGAVLWEIAAGRSMRSHSDLTSGRFDAPPLPTPVAARLNAATPEMAGLIESLTRTRPEDRARHAEEACGLLPN